MTQLSRKSKSGYDSIKFNVFKAFTDVVGGDLDDFASTAFERYTMDNPAYNDPLIFSGVENYLINTVVPHKIAVYKAGLELMSANWFTSLQIGQAEFIDNLFLHDLSKFSANEAYSYSTHDFKNPKPEARRAFERAWHHHKMHNEHHAEHWLNPNRSGGLEILPMPKIYIIEMVADWIGAGRTYGNELTNWLPDNIGKFKLHEETALILIDILKNIGFELRWDGTSISVVGK